MNDMHDVMIEANSINAKLWSPGELRIEDMKELLLHMQLEIMILNRKIEALEASDDGE